MRESVLWGHHFNEYQQMFNLVDIDMNARILEYGCGATAVNAELHARHQTIVSCDPLFSLSNQQLHQSVLSTFEEAVQHLKNASTQYDFSRYGTMEALIQQRCEGITEFLADYGKGHMEKRYLPFDGETLPFKDFSFDYALSAYFLFSALEDQDVDFHLRCIRELARVAKDVRIFPLIDRSGQPSPLLGPVLLGLQQTNYAVEVHEVDYQLQLGDHAMLRVWARECPL